MAATNGEIFHAIGRRIKEESPYRDTMVITHAGQWTAYVKDDSGEGEYETAVREQIRQMLKEFAGAR